MSIQHISNEELISEVEMLEFAVNEQRFGVNILKIRQIIRFEPQKLSKPPRSIEAMVGLLKIQNRMTPVIDLNQFFYNQTNVISSESKEVEKIANRIVIVLEFNRSWYGFLVDSVHKIHRVSSDEIKSVEEGMPIEYVSSIVNLQGITSFILDFEMLVSRLFHLNEHPIAATPISNNTANDAIIEKRILLIDDSKVTRDVVQSFLRNSGFKTVETAIDGKEGYEKFAKAFNAEANTSGFDVVISDIEMPQLDGFSVCKKIKALKPNQKVILFSSLANQKLLLQSNEVGADKLVSKRDTEKLHHIIHELF